MLFKGAIMNTNAQKTDVQALDFFSKTGNTVHTNKLQADARTVIFSGFFYVLFILLLQKDIHSICLLCRNCPGTRESRAPLFGSGSSFGFFIVKKLINTNIYKEA